MLHLLLLCHLAHSLRIRHTSRHALSSHLLHTHTSAWMLTGHAPWCHALRAMLHAHHNTRLGDVRGSRHALMHLHRLSHMLSRIWRHSRVAMRETRVALGVVCGHHLA